MSKTMPHFSQSTQKNSNNLSLTKVWDILSTNLRDVRNQIHDVNSDLYGIQDRIEYLEIIQDALKYIGARQVSKVESFFVMEELYKKMSEMSKYENEVKSLNDFHIRCKKVFSKIQAIKHILTDDIMQFLDLHCSDYRKLGIADDSFYNSLQSRTAVIDNYMERFEELSGFVNDGHPIPKDLFGYSFFSQELSIELDCDSFPVLRVIPDLIQKLEMSCDIAADWLRTDKVYVQEMEKEIELQKLKVSDIERAICVKKHEYEHLFANLKNKQTKLKQYDYKKIKIELIKLEAKRAHINLELSASHRNLATCDHRMRELADCEATESEYESDSSVAVDFIHSSYARRLHGNQSPRLENLRLQKIKIESTLSQNTNQLKEAVALEATIEKLSKKTRTTGRQKMKLVEQLKWCQGQVNSLTGFLKEKMNPDLQQREGIMKEEKSQRKAQRKSESRSERKNGLELEEAFQIVKNSIGLGWKDLARTLPYRPTRNLQEINSEIKAIEYENQGQLKEQAYQTLIQWSGHNGRRASIERLQDTLRELHENKLADDIEEKLLDKTDAESDISRPSSFN